MPETLKTEEHLIRGCQSKVWLNAQSIGGKLYFSADSDAFISKGLIAMVIRVLSGQRAEDIVNADLYFMEVIGLKNHLSSSRSNGLLSMVQRIFQVAQLTNQDNNKTLLNA